MATNTMMTSWTDGAEVAPSASPSFLARVAAQLTIFGGFGRAMRIRFEMSRLSDRNLADMGLTRRDIRRIARGQTVVRQQTEL